jgi:hypothetical protein
VTPIAELDPGDLLLRRYDPDDPGHVKVDGAVRRFASSVLFEVVVDGWASISLYSDAALVASGVERCVCLEGRFRRLAGFIVSDVLRVLAEHLKPGEYAVVHEPTSTEDPSLKRRESAHCALKLSGSITRSRRKSVTGRIVRHARPVALDREGQAPPI